MESFFNKIELDSYSLKIKYISDLYDFLNFYKMDKFDIKKFYQIVNKYKSQFPRNEILIKDILCKIINNNEVSIVKFEINPNPSQKTFIECYDSFSFKGFDYNRFFFSSEKLIDIIIKYPKKW